MKRLSQLVTLKRTLEEITISEFRQCPGEVLQSVELGRTFIITKVGKPLAVLSKVPGEQLAIVAGTDGAVSYSLES